MLSCPSTLYAFIFLDMSLCSTEQFGTVWIASHFRCKRHSHRSWWDVSQNVTGHVSTADTSRANQKTENIPLL